MKNLIQRIKNWCKRFKRQLIDRKNRYIENYNRKHPNGVGKKYVKINKIDE